uniref:Putative lysosomal trafficking regulator n=1 Tax=Ixodes scapularis TaxID=6945 RepID=A0A4D5RRJ4_IXOSC
MKALSRCGVCCCLTLSDVSVPLLRGLSTKTAEDRESLLELLQKCIYNQLGLYTHTCPSCLERSETGEDACAAYAELLGNENAEVQLSVGKHLLTVLGPARPFFRSMLCSRVALPCFLALGESSASVAGDPESSPTWFALSAFALLGPSASPLFPHDSKQTKILYSLLSNSTAPVFRHAALLLLETLILSSGHGAATENTATDSAKDKHADDRGDGCEPRKADTEADDTSTNGDTDSSVDGETGDWEALGMFSRFLAAETRQFLRKVKASSSESGMDDSMEGEAGCTATDGGAEEREAELSRLAELWLACRRVAQDGAVRHRLRAEECCGEGYRLLLWMADRAARGEPCGRRMFAALETLLSLLLELCPLRLWSEFLESKDLVRELRNQLHGCLEVSRSSAEWRCLLDALLGNLVHRTQPPQSPRSTRSGGGKPEFKRGRLSQSGTSTTSEHSLSAEQLGYEGDSESTPEDDSACLPDGTSATSREAGDVSVTCYVEVCSLVLDLVCRLCPVKAGVVLHAVQRLTALCSQHSLLLNLFVEQGAVGKLCHGLGCLLEMRELPDSPEHHTLELQESLVTLLVLLCRRSLSSRDLVAYLQLLRGPHSAFGPLLRGLLALSNCGDRGPQCYLKFPALGADDDDEVMLLPGASHGPEEGTKGDGPWSASDRKRGGAWGQAVLVLPVTDHSNWCPRASGFSVSLWLSLRSGSLSGRKCARLHLVSVGCGSFLLEAWAEDVEKGDLSLWITRDASDDGACHGASQCSLEGALSGRSWHHLALCYREKVSHDSLNALVTVTIDGQRDQTWELPLDGIVSDQCSHQPSPAVLLGQSGANDASASSLGTGDSWGLGNVMLFQGACLGPAECLALHARGSDAVAPTSCLLDEREPLVVDVTPASVRSSAPTWAQLAGNLREALSTIEERLLLWFCPQRSDSFVAYPRPSPFLASLLGQRNEGRHRGLPSRRATLRLSPVQLQWERHLHHAAAGLGGPGLFLFLLARVVECTTEPLPQALALELMLGLLRRPGATWGVPRALLGQQETLDLLGQLVANSRWAADSPHCLQVALNACTNRALVQCDGEGGVRPVSHPAGQEPLLVWPQLLCVLVEHWRPGPGWRDLLGAVWGLVRERHRHRDFNLAQGAPLLHRLLGRLKRLLVDECSPSLGPPGTLSLVLKLLGALVQPAVSSQLAGRLSACLDLLLLLHKSSDAHVAQGPFYYLPAMDCKGTAPQPPVGSLTSSPSASSLSESTGDCHPASRRSSSQEPSPETENAPEPSKTEVSVSFEALDCADGQSLVDANLASVHGTSREMCPVFARSRSAPPGTKGTATKAMALLLSGKTGDLDHVEATDSLETGCPFGKGRSSPRPLSPSGANDSKPASTCLWEEEEGEEKSADDDITGLIRGLLTLLRDVLLSSSESLVQEKLEPVVRPEALLVLAHNRDPVVRNQVVCALEAYLAKSSPEMESRFLKAKGFQLLGLQLAQHPATATLVQSCCRLLLGRPVLLARKIPRCTLSNQAASRASVTLLLALLPRTAQNPALCHGTLTAVTQLCDSVEGAAHLLFTNGLGESLATLVLSAPAHSPFRHSSDAENEADIVEAILSLLRTLTLQTCRAMTQQSGKLSTDCFHSLCGLFARLTEAHTTYCGEDCRGSLIFRECQAQLYLAALELLYGYGSEVIAGAPGPTSPTLLEAFAIMAAPLAGDLEGLSPDMQPSDSLGSAWFRPPDTRPIPGRAATVSTVSRELGTIFVQACDFVVYQALPCQRSPTELVLVSVLLKKAVAGIILAQASRKSKRKMNSLEQLTFSLKHIFPNLLSRLCVHLFAPGQDPRLGLHAAQTLVSCGSFQEALRVALGPSNESRTQVRTFTQDLLCSLTQEGTIEGATLDVVTLVAAMSQEAPSTLPRSPNTEKAAGEAAQKARQRWQVQWAAQREAWLVRTPSINDKKSNYQRKLEAKASRAAGEAARVTRSVAELLHALRKELLSDAKARSCRDLVLRQAWFRIATQLTHERAPWYFPECFPANWELDPTEGPSRVRRRLRRAFLGVGPQFLKPEFRGALGNPDTVPPLHFLYDSDASQGESATFLHHLYINERITHTSKCTRVFPSSEMHGEVLLGENSLQFVPEELGKHKCALGEEEARHEVWPYAEVQEVLLRRFRLRDNALELFLRNGVTALLAFQTTQDRNEFCRHLRQCPQLQVQPPEALETLSQRWQERRLTNFEYLTQLNKLAGRSFNDLMQYPVFPFVLAHYEGHSLDLEDPSAFRQLERPIAVQDPSREAHYLHNFRVEQSTLPEERLLPWLGPFHYGSHYSNSGTVLQFLVRLPPFTQMFLSYQGNQFDLPDRTFHSLHTTWRLASRDSTTDVKELIPEFFYLPEFLVNGQGFDLGVRQTGEVVSDVNLPPWCRGDPRLFVLVHRQALESDHVTERLGHWIDLVFGYKQTGKAAQDAINVFHPATYYGVDVSLFAHDTVMQEALETMICTYGQMPRQLFSSPHPLVSLPLASVQQRNAPLPTTQVAMAEIRGLRWGSYVGSPSDPAPRLVLVRAPLGDQSLVGKLLPLRTNDVWGLPPNSCLLLGYSHDKEGPKTATQTYISSTALVSWQHADGLVRLKLHKEEVPVPLLGPCPGDAVSLCSTAPDCHLLFVGYSSGLVTIHKVRLSGTKVDNTSKPACLLGHTDAITAVQVCTAFGLVVTASRDGSSIVWDLSTGSSMYARWSRGVPPPAEEA